MALAPGKGDTTPLPAEAMPYTKLSISPRGDRVAFEVRDSGVELRVWDFERETMARVTFDPRTDGHPVWLADDRLIFESHRVPQGNLYEKAADGTGEARRLRESPHNNVPQSVSPDGKWLVFEERTPERSNDLMLYSFETQSVEPLVSTEFNETSGTISPDGRFLAYHSNESGRVEVYVRSFPNAGEGKWPVSSTGGSHPVWSRDGWELFFLDAERRLNVVTTQSGARTSEAFSASRPERLMDHLFPAGGTALAYDVSPDGKRFLTLGEELSELDEASEIHVVTNWFEELKRLDPN